MHSHPFKVFDVDFLETNMDTMGCSMATTSQILSTIMSSTSFVAISMQRMLLILSLLWHQDLPGVQLSIVSGTWWVKVIDMQALCSISWAHCNQYCPNFDWVGGTLHRNMDTPPILQLAFQYSILVPQDEDAIPVSSNGKSSQKALSNSRYDKPKCLVFGKLLEKLLIPCSVMYYPALLFYIKNEEMSTNC